MRGRWRLSELYESVGGVGLDGNRGATLFYPLPREYRELVSIFDFQLGVHYHVHLTTREWWGRVKGISQYNVHESPSQI